MAIDLKQVSLTMQKNKDANTAKKEKKERKKSPQKSIRIFK